MGVRENKIEKYLDSEVKKLGGLTRKWVSPGNNGVPDRIVFLMNSIYFVEVKTSDGWLSPGQEREIERLRNTGAMVHVVYDTNEVDMFIDEIKQKIVRH